MIGNAVSITTSKMPEDFGGDDGKNPAAKSLGQGGGKVRAMALSAKRRKEIARHAAQPRWDRAGARTLWRRIPSKRSGNALVFFGGLGQGATDAPLRPYMPGKIEIPHAAQEPRSGIVRPPLLSAWFGTLFGLLMIVAAVWAAMINSYDMTAALGFLGIVFTVAAVPQVIWRHEVRWNQKEIEGPAKMLGLTLGAARTEIAWSDIVRAGRTMTGYWYVESGDGRRVYWSYLSAGRDALRQALRGHCPTLQFDFHLPT